MSQTQAATNDVGATAESRHRGNHWQAFDQLPAPLRRSLQEAAVELCPMFILSVLRRQVKRGVPASMSVRALVQSVQFSERQEIEQFSQEVFGDAGSSHVRAEATIQRYDRRDEECAA